MNEKITKDHILEIFILTKVYLCKKWKFKLIGRFCLRKCTRTVIPTIFLPSLLFSLPSFPFLFIVPSRVQPLFLYYYSIITQWFDHWIFGWAIVVTLKSFYIWCLNMLRLIISEQERKTFIRSEAAMISRIVNLFKN